MPSAHPSRVCQTACQVSDLPSNVGRCSRVARGLGRTSGDTPPETQTSCHIQKPTTKTKTRATHTTVLLATKLRTTDASSVRGLGSGFVVGFTVHFLSRYWGSHAGILDHRRAPGHL